MPYHDSGESYVGSGGCEVLLILPLCSEMLSRPRLKYPQAYNFSDVEEVIDGKISTFRAIPIVTNAHARKSYIICQYQCQLRSREHPTAEAKFFHSSRPKPLGCGSELAPIEEFECGVVVAANASSITALGLRKHRLSSAGYQPDEATPLVWRREPQGIGMILRATFLIAVHHPSNPTATPQRSLHWPRHGCSRFALP